MDNNTITINLQNVSEEDKAKLLEIMRKSQKSKGRWKPNYGNSYHFITKQDEIVPVRWYGTTEDNARYVLGNCFPTMEAAEFALEKRKLLVEMEDYALAHNEYEIDWKDFDQFKHYVGYQYDGNEILVCHTWDIKLPSEVYFTSPQIAKDCIAALGEDRIKKYLFGIES